MGILPLEQEAAVKASKLHRHLSLAAANGDGGVKRQTKASVRFHIPKPQSRTTKSRLFLAMD
jgi:hypothetical protein